MTALVVAGPSGATEHLAGRQHPERQARVLAVMEGVDTLAREGSEVVSLEAVEAPVDALARVHSPAYLAQLEAFCAEGGGHIDADTYARADSWAAARRAAGAGSSRWTSSNGAARGWRSCPCARPAITRWPIAPWASALSTTSPSPRRRAWHAASAC